VAASVQVGCYCALLQGLAVWTWHSNAQVYVCVIACNIRMCS
jgi:hypothetical protein